MKRALLALAVLVVALAALVLWRGSKSQRLPLPDGSILTLREVTYGTKHRHVFGPIWQKLYALVPEKLRPVKLRNVAVFTNSEPFIAFWFTREHVPNSPDVLSYFLEDAQGFAAGWEAYSWGTTTASPQRGIGKGFGIWPRREANLRLGIYRRVNQSLERVGGFTTENPAPQKYPRWPAESPPASAMVGNYEFMLRRLVVGATKDLKPSDDPNEPRVRAEFRVRRGDRPSISWSPATIKISDATGNRSDIGSWSLQSIDDGLQMNFRSPLWPEEPWKLHVEFSRSANYASNELVQLPPVEVPKELLNGKSTNTFALNITTNWQGIPVTITGIEGSSRNFATPAVRVRCGALPADHRLTLVKMEDDQKRNVSGRGSTGDRWEYGYSLRLASNSMTLHLTMAIHKSVFADFVVKPDVVKPPDALPTVSPESSR